MANVNDVANFFIETAGDESDMTNLKLNKMLFFAQGVHLARTGTPLFDDPIEAWRYGPVVPDIYYKYNICKNNPIGATGANVDGVFENEEQDTLLDVLREYGKYSAGHLVNKTHESSSPWSNTPPNDRISLETMRNYFENHAIVDTFADTLRTSNIPIIIGRRDENGVLVFPSEEDEGWGEYN